MPESRLVYRTMLHNIYIGNFIVYGMEVKKFRIQNYKKICDSGWIECSSMTGFVGKNESGKSALFRGLSKFNPSDGQKYDLMKEFPRRRYSAEHDKENWPVSSVEFHFDEDDVESLINICPIFSQIKSVIMTKYYSDRYSFTFQPDEIPPSVTIQTYLQILENWKIKIESFSVPEGKGDLLGAIKQTINPVITATIQDLKKQDLRKNISMEILEKISNIFTSNLNEEWQQKLFEGMVKENNKKIEALKLLDSFANAKNWIMTAMPKFIYFDKYDILESAVHIKEFIQRIKENPEDPRLRITKCLFQQVNLDIDKISSLNPNDHAKTNEELKRMARERSIDLSSASSEMTEKFSDWWEQRKHKFRYDMDGDIFQLWVSDDLDPSEIELEQRSAGLQYFFSFYLVFLVEAKNAYKNSILLLDEPGLYYHGTAQKKTVEFLQKISQDNQIMYTTHSPFMIDGDHLENIRIVYEDENTGNTRVSSDVWPDDEDSLFPLQAGLGYSLAQTLFFSKYNLVVEGISDYLILQSMNNLLVEKGMKQLNSNIVITPAGGVKKILPLAGLLLGNKMNLAFLLDGDEPGIEKAMEINKKLSLNCMLTSSFSDNQHTEIEDLFPESVYMRALRNAYPNLNIKFSDDEKHINRIIKRTEKAFERSGFEKFKKWNVLKSMIDIINNESSYIPEETCKIFEKIFVQTNQILKLNSQKNK